MIQTELIDLVIACIEDLNESLDQPVPLDRGSATALYGRDGSLDSLSLVTLIMDVEQAIHNKASISVTLASEHAMAQATSPFRTIESFADYALALVEEQRGHE